MKFRQKRPKGSHQKQIGYLTKTLKTPTAFLSLVSSVQDDMERLLLQLDQGKGVLFITLIASLTQHSRLASSLYNNTQ